MRCYTGLTASKQACMRLRPMRIERSCRHQIYLATLRLLGHIGGAVVHLLATAIEEGRDLSSMSGIQTDTAYRRLLA
jgi:NAD-dependent oxidoreductase involved in siderophore biosynthesis